MITQKSGRENIPSQLDALKRGKLALEGNVWPSFACSDSGRDISTRSPYRWVKRWDKIGSLRKTHPRRPRWRSRPPQPRPRARSRRWASETWPSAACVSWELETRRCGR